MFVNSGYMAGPTRHRVENEDRLPALWCKSDCDVEVLSPNTQGVAGTFHECVRDRPPADLRGYASGSYSQFENVSDEVVTQVDVETDFSTTYRAARTWVTASVLEAARRGLRESALLAEPEASLAFASIDRDERRQAR